MHMIFNLGPHISTRWRRFLHWGISRLRSHQGELPSLYRLSQIKEAFPRPNIVKRTTRSGAEFHFIPPTELLKYIVSRPDVYKMVMDHQLPKLEPETVADFTETPRSRCLSRSFGACNVTVGDDVYYQGDLVLLCDPKTKRDVLARLTEIVNHKGSPHIVAHRLKPLSSLPSSQVPLPSSCTKDDLAVLRHSEYILPAAKIKGVYIGVRGISSPHHFPVY